MPHPLTEMSLEEQLGQLFMVGFWETTPSQGLIDLIQNDHVGGIILFSRNIQDAQQLRTLTHELQRIAQDAGQRFPLLIAIDQENGIVQRLGHAGTQFPGNMALGAIGAEQVAYDVALATGRELRALGITMNLAPVVDVNNNSANPVIGVRSFGENPQHVAGLARAAVRGYRAAGIISTLKHFPGHGDTTIDSHLALPLISHELNRLNAVELVPFRSGIAAGADSIMLAHIVFPALTQDSYPATIAPAVIQGLLREQLGFTGMVISDCMEMHAIAKTIGTQRACVMALQAGVDVVLVSHTYALQRSSMETVRTAVLANEVSLQRVQQAVGRVLNLKQRFLSWEETAAVNILTAEEEQAHRQLSNVAYERSTTLLRNADNLLPLRLTPDKRLLVLSLRDKAQTLAEDRHYPSEILIDIVRRHHATVETLHIPPIVTASVHEQVRQAALEADIIIAVMVNALLDQQQAQLMHLLLQTGRPIIGIVAGIPYDIQAFPDLHTCLLTYEYTRPALEAAVGVLFGAISPQGQVPVSIS